jgi:RNA polymerase sigma factor (sigma-70 family)
MPGTDTNVELDMQTNLGRAVRVFEENGDFIRSVIRCHVRNETEAEDLFQDLFLFMISKPLPAEVQNVKAFLYKVIRDMIADAFRRMDRYHARIRRYSERERRTAQHCPDDVVMQLEETNKLFEMIERRLPPNEALAVTLRYRDSHNIEEVADRMQIKPRSVSRYLSVGLKKVRCFLGEESRTQT